MADVAADLLVVLHSALADANFFVYHRLFFHPSAFFGKRHTDFLIGADFARNLRSGRGYTFYNQFFAGDWNLDVLVLGDDLLAKADFATLNPFLVSAQDFAAKLNAVILLVVAGGCVRVGARAGQVFESAFPQLTAVAFEDGAGLAAVTAGSREAASRGW